MFGLTSKKKVTEILDQKAEEIQSLQLKASRAETALTENNQLNRALFQMLYSNTIVPYQAEATAFIDKGYCYNPHLYTVINFIGRNISQVPFRLYKVTDKKRHSAYLEYKNKGDFDGARALQYKSMEEVEKGGLHDLLKQPNEAQGWSEYIYEKRCFYELLGNSYTYGLTPAGFDERLFSQLYNAPPQLIDIISGGFMQPISKYKLKYTYTKELEIEAYKMLHQKNWNPRVDQNGQSLFGMSPVEPLLRTLKRSNESVDASLALLKNGAPAGIVSNDSGVIMESEDIDKAEKAAQAKFGGGVNKNRIMHAATKVSWQAIGLSSVDLELLASNDIDLKTFCHIYGIDDIIFITDNSSYNNKIIAERDVWYNTLIPKLKEERDALNRWLVPAWSKLDGVDYYIDFDLSEINAIQTDYEKLSQRVEREMKVGLWSPNEARVMMGKEPVMNVDMDKNYIDSSLKTLGEAKDPLLELLGSVSPLVANSLIAAIPPEMLAELFNRVKK